MLLRFGGQPQAFLTECQGKAKGKRAPLLLHLFTNIVFFQASFHRAGQRQAETFHDGLGGLISTPKRYREMRRE